MATTILPFVARKRPVEQASRARGEAMVIIFPGVRYEHRPDTDDARTQKRVNVPVRGRRKSKS
jgi:orotidine-5'-phosphate decarboxylase